MKKILDAGAEQDMDVSRLGNYKLDDDFQGLAVAGSLNHVPVAANLLGG